MSRWVTGIGRSWTQGVGVMFFFREYLKWQAHGTKNQVLILSKKCSNRCIMHCILGFTDNFHSVSSQWWGWARLARGVYDSFCFWYKAHRSMWCCNLQGHGRNGGISSKKNSIKKKFLFFSRKLSRKFIFKTNWFSSKTRN